MSRRNCNDLAMAELGISAQGGDHARVPVAARWRMIHLDSARCAGRPCHVNSIPSEPAEGECQRAMSGDRRRRSHAATSGGRSCSTVAATMLWAVSKYRCVK